MKNIKLYIYILFSSVLVFISCSNKKESADKAATAGAPKPAANVEGFIIQPQTLPNTIRTSGTVLASEEVELHTEATGRITKIYFAEGGKVNRNDLLIKINDDDLQAQLRKTSSQIKLAREQLKRQEELLKINATSKQEFDIISNELSSLIADEEIIKSAISKTELRAPFKGTIGLRYVSEGSYVTPATRVAAIQNIDPVKIDFSIPEKYAALVKKNNEVSFINEQSAVSFLGKVYAIEPRIDAATRTLRVRAVCENSKGAIIPGSFVKVELQLNEIKDAMMIPTQALLPVLKGHNVYIVKNGLSKTVPVKTGIRTESEIQITEGLSAGDTILTKGIISLRPNNEVKVKLVNR